MSRDGTKVVGLKIIIRGVKNKKMYYVIMLFVISTVVYIIIITTIIIIIFYYNIFSAFSYYNIIEIYFNINNEIETSLLYKT